MYEKLKPGTRESDTSDLEFLSNIRGKYIVSGIHNREPNAQPMLQTQKIQALTGVCPGLWSGDFLFLQEDVAHRWDMIYACETQWKAGSLVNLMFHVTSPLSDEVGQWDGDVIRNLTDEEWSDLTTEGGRLNQVWKKRLDGYVPYLQYLKDAGVTPMFRPFHEMNQGLFWWGGRPGLEGTAALYRLTHDYLVHEKHMDHLIWVWDMQDLDEEWARYNPGEAYWDIFAVDIYDETGFTDRKYRIASSIAGDKPMAIGECQVLPTLQELENQPLWTFFMSWAELTFEYNTDDQIRTLYGGGRVLTLGEKE